jgi:hypothetical protein
MQEPGPPGFPQLPQAAGSDPLAGSCEEVANTESFLSSLWPWHEGHSGTSLARTSFSNSVPQLEQEYSKIGMLTSKAGDHPILHRSRICPREAVDRYSGGGRSLHPAFLCGRIPVNREEYRENPCFWRPEICPSSRKRASRASLRASPPVQVLNRTGKYIAYIRELTGPYQGSNSGNRDSNSHSTIGCVCVGDGKPIAGHSRAQEGDVVAHQLEMRVADEVRGPWCR